MIMTEPYGVVGAITPWNFPISMAGWKLGPALAAGNAVVLKPSEMTPFSTLYMAELAVRAGMPAGLINIVLGDGQRPATRITGHPDIAKVSFTGSTAAGAAIMENIARTGIKPMTLELGGKSPQVVFADADLDLAGIGNRAQHSRPMPARLASPVSRLIVERRVAEQLTAALCRAHGRRSGPARPGTRRRTTRRSSPSASSNASTASCAAAIQAGGRVPRPAAAPWTVRLFLRADIALQRRSANRRQSSRRSSVRC